MEPLSQEEIESMEADALKFFGGMDTEWSRLFYTARLGAEFVRITEKYLDTEEKKV